MQGLLVDCPTHGIVRDSFFGIDESQDIEFFGVDGRCSKCGRPAPVVDGVYSETGGVVSAILRPTPAQAIRLRNFLAWGIQQVEEGTSSEEVVRARLNQMLEREAPAWRKAIDALLSERAISLYALLGFLMMMLTFFGVDPAHQAEIANEPPPAITEDQMRRLFDEFVEQLPAPSEPSRPTPEPATPKPEPPTIQA